MAYLETPLISIVIPCYNGATTIVEAIRSALDQTYRNIEIIVVDDGSTDDSGAIVQELMISEPSVSLYIQENKGLPAARNFGLRFARGEYVVFLDADDRLKETYISLAFTYHHNNPDTTIVYSNMELFERETGIQSLAPFEIKLFLRSNCIPAFAMVKTEKIRAIGGFDESVTLYEDWECWMHLIKVFGGEVYRIEEPQYFYRKRYSKDSIMDRNTERKEKVIEVTAYIFFKHRDLYVQNGMFLNNFFDLQDETARLKKKYYHIWYRRLFYKWFRPTKYAEIYGLSLFCYTGIVYACFIIFGILHKYHV